MLGSPTHQTDEKIYVMRIKQSWGSNQTSVLESTVQTVQNLEAVSPRKSNAEWYAVTTRHMKDSPRSRPSTATPRRPATASSKEWGDEGGNGRMPGYMEERMGAGAEGQARDRVLGWVDDSCDSSKHELVRLAGDMAELVWEGEKMLDALSANDAQEIVQLLAETDRSTSPVACALRAHIVREAGIDTASRCHELAQQLPASGSSQLEVREAAAAISRAHLTLTPDVSSSSCPRALRMVSLRRVVRRP